MINTSRASSNANSEQKLDVSETVFFFETFKISSEFTLLITREYIEFGYYTRIKKDSWLLLKCVLHKGLRYLYKLLVLSELWKLGVYDGLNM